MINPYQDLPDAQFWRRSISAVESHRIDPVVDVRVRIGAGDQVGTAGSCFAQHISRRLSKLGLDYLITEHGSNLPISERQARQFGLFSARYGNIYTPAQFTQLIEEAFRCRQPIDRAWPRKDGRWIDPFRQTVEPDGFISPEDVAEDRNHHLAAVRRLVSEIDVLVFTLGLTEAWRSKKDGSVYPIAPGVVGGEYNEKDHEFVNFSAPDTEAAMAAALTAMKAVNPRLRVILTVSPVPLIATFERRSALVSTAYSKAVLRVAAESLMQRFDWVDYFPSFEIITGPATAGLYFEEDRREVNALGVAHVMRIFERHHVKSAAAISDGMPLVAPAATADAGIVCDEAMIDAVRA